MVSWREHPNNEIAKPRRSPKFELGFLWGLASVPNLRQAQEELLERWEAPLGIHLMFVARMNESLGSLTGRSKLALGEAQKHKAASKSKSNGCERTMTHICLLAR